MSTTVSCGECGALLRDEQAWCAICYAPVSAAFDPLTAPLDQVMALPDVGQVESDLVAPAPTSQVDAYEGAAPEGVPEPPAYAQLDWRSAMVEPSALATTQEPEGESESGESTELTDVDVMLSMLAAEHRQSDLTAGLADRFGDRSTRLAVIFGGMAVIATVVFALLTILGALV